MGRERVSRVSLTATVGNYVSGFEQAKSVTKQFSEQAQESLEKQKAAMERLGTASLAFGATAAAAVGLAVSKYAEFDAAMSSVQAATHETAANMGLLRTAAIEAGASTVFTAKEAANAIEELAKAGVSTSDIIGGALAGSLDLASAGELGVADAAEIAATAMTQFKLKGADVPHIADLLAAGAGKAQGSVMDLAGALNQGGLVASQAGQSIEDTTGVLAAFAAAGLVGSDAGTSLKTMLLALENPAAKASEVMKTYKIDVYDSNGEMLNFAGIADQLKTKLSGLTDEQRNTALATIFGSDAVRSASVLYDQGADGIQTWTDNVNDSGYAAETARIKLDNLNGDVEKLGGAFDTLLIKSGSAADGLSRGVVQALTEVLDMFNDAPLFVQQTALALAAVAAAVALAGGAFLVGVPQVAAFNAALITLSTSTIPGVATASTLLTGATAKASTALAATAKFMTGPWGVAIAAAVAGGMLLNDAFEKMKASAAEYQNVIQNATSAQDLFKIADKGVLVSQLDQATSSTKAFQDALDNIAHNEFATGLSLSTQQLRQRLKDLGTQIGDVAATDLPSAQNAFKLLADDMELSHSQQIDLLNSMPAYKAALQDQANELGVNIDATNEAASNNQLLKLAFGESGKSATAAADDYLEAQDSTDALADSVKDLLDQFNEMNGVNQDAVSANAQWQESLAGITEQVNDQKDAFIALQSDAYEQANGSLEGFVGTLDGFTLSLDQNTVSGSANANALSQVASDAQAAALAQYEVDKSTMGVSAATEKYLSTAGTSRQALIDSATAAGYNADEVQGLVDKIYAIPTAPEVKIATDTAAATSTVDAFGRYMDDALSPRTVSVNVAIAGAVNAIDAFARGNENGGMYVDGVQAFANGGFPSGIYKGRKGAIHKFAEENVGWEAYVSGKPGQEDRNRGILMDAASRLGMGTLVPASMGSESSGPNYFTGQLVTDTGYVIGVVQGQLEKASRDRATTLSTGRAR